MANAKHKTYFDLLRLARREMLAKHYLVYAEIVDRQWLKGYCTAGQNSLAESCGVDVRTIQRSLAWLDDGWITRQFRRGHPGRSGGRTSDLITLDMRDISVDNSPEIPVDKPVEHDNPVRFKSRRTRQSVYVEPDNLVGVTVEDNSKEQKKSTKRKVSGAAKAVDDAPLTTPAASRSQRGTRFSLTSLPDDWRAAASKIAPSLDANTTFDTFRDYWIAVPGQKGIKLDWLATWRNWIRRDSNRGNGNGKHRNTNSDNGIPEHIKRAIAQSEQAREELIASRIVEKDVTPLRDAMDSEQRRGDGGEQPVSDSTALVRNAFRIHH